MSTYINPCTTAVLNLLDLLTTTTYYKCVEIVIDNMCLSTWHKEDSCKEKGLTNNPADMPRLNFKYGGWVSLLFILFANICLSCSAVWLWRENKLRDIIVRKQF